MLEKYDKPPTLAVALTTFNSMRTISQVVESVINIADKIVIVDSGSTDGTIEYCKQKGCEVVHKDWDGIVKQRRYSIEKCSPAKWVLSLDSDEILEPELQKAVREAVECDDSDINGYEINRKMWYLGGWLNHLYYPEWRLRMVRPEKATVTGVEDIYHDRIEVKGTTGRLAGICKHDSYASLKDHAERQIRFAARTAGRESKGRWWDFFFSPLGTVFQMLIRKRCFMDGKRGWIAFAMAVNFKLLKHSFQMLDRLEQQEKSKQQCI